MVVERQSAKRRAKGGYRLLPHKQNRPEVIAGHRFEGNAVVISDSPEVDLFVGSILCRVPIPEVKGAKKDKSPDVVKPVPPAPPESEPVTTPASEPVVATVQLSDSVDSPEVPSSPRKRARRTKRKAE